MDTKQAINLLTSEFHTWSHVVFDNADSHQQDAIEDLELTIGFLRKCAKSEQTNPDWLSKRYAMARKQLDILKGAIGG